MSTANGMLAAPPAPDPDRTLYLIDGHAQIFRAYYAIRGGMTSSVTGEPTNASFAFAGMLLKFFEELRPRYAVMAIDTPGKTFRDDMYAEYKANRESPPDDFAVQIPRIFDMTRLFGIPIVGDDNAEADDVIATLVQQTLDDPDRADMTVRMVSKDKDLEQLLGPRVSMYDIHTDTLLDEAWLLEQRGITPQQVIDLLALMGDKVDNVPGVDGVGPKTAVKLIQEFGSLEGVIENVDKIKGKRHDNIVKATPHLPLSKRLVTLKHDVELDFTLDQAAVGRMDAEGLKALFRELGFRRHTNDVDRLVTQLGGADAAGGASAESSTSAAGGEELAFQEGLFGSVESESPVPTTVDDGLETASDCEYTAVTTRDELDTLVETLRKQKIVSVDTETVGLGHRAALCGVCLAWESGKGVYVPVKSPDTAQHLDETTVLDALGPVLQDTSIGKCGHNLKYDLLVLRHAGVAMRGVVFDSMIASHLVGSSGHGLDHLAETMAGHRMTPISNLIGPKPKGKGSKGKSQKTMDQVPLEAITPYAAEDADLALRLRDAFVPKLKALGVDALADDVEMPLVEVLAEMEYHGIKVDPDELQRQEARLAERIVELRDRILELAGEPFNLDSPKQLGDILFNKLGLPVVKRTKTGPSTDIEVLEKLADSDDVPADKAEVPRLIVEYRQLTKLTNTYLVALREAIDEKTGRVHATFHQTGAATGRLSSSGPNLQNIPIRTEVGRQIRRAFVAERGQVLISADYSQIELRVLAHLSGDPALIDAFKEGMDIHTAVACQVFEIEPDDVTTEQRTHAKTINFGIVYGVTPFGLARRIENLDLDGAKKMIEDYKSRFAGIGTFLAECIDQAQRQGYVSTILGRRRSIPQIDSRNPNTRALGERLAINSVVQGSAADLIKKAMVDIHRQVESDSKPIKMLLQIHDELVFETPEAEASAMVAFVTERMEAAMSLQVPLKVDANVGPDWLAAK